MVPPQGLMISGFTDDVTGALTPFKLCPLEGDETPQGGLLKCAKEPHGEIVVRVYGTTPSTPRTCTDSVFQPPASTQQITAKKAVLNGLATEKGEVTEGDYTYTSAPFSQGDFLGSTTLTYRDHAAVLLLLGEEEMQKAKAQGKGKVLYL